MRNSAIAISSVLPQAAVSVMTIRTVTASLTSSCGMSLRHGENWAVAAVVVLHVLIFIIKTVVSTQAVVSGRTTGAETEVLVVLYVLKYIKKTAASIQAAVSGRTTGAEMTDKGQIRMNC